MRSLTNFESIMLHRNPVDGRKQINGLAVLVQESFKTNPTNGSLFVFINKGKDLVRLLYWDRTGFAMWVKRLEKQRFRWPTKFPENGVPLSHKQLKWLLDGLDIMAIQPHETLTFQTVK